MGCQARLIGCCDIEGPGPESCINCCRYDCRFLVAYAGMSWRRYGPHIQKITSHQLEQSHSGYHRVQYEVVFVGRVGWWE